jgi:tetratricopeptide (TPR) repeat protein
MFTGRADELAVFDQLHQESTVVITTVDGMAGIGKTALAIHAAHRIADRYPDGQLFLDLHGYTHGVAPVAPAEALDHMLRALGIPGPHIPERLDQRAGLYRSRLADQRMLIVLDNAATEPQVIPLLPGAPGCLVLITSRRRLAGLDHTHTVSLDVLPPPDAVALFRKSAGGDRLAGQPPDVVAELVERCGRLPLAIRIAAARLRSHSAWNLSNLVQRLRDQRHRLVELEAGQRSIIAALDLSYQHLSPDQQRTYRLLGLHPGPDIDAYATGALLDSTLLDAGRMLEQLLEAHLLQEPTPGRYRLHDLTRAHAAYIATRDEAGHEHSKSLDRLIEHYRHTASLAMDVAYPYDRERRPQVPPARTPSPDLSDPALAVSWLDTELPNLLAAAKYATAHDRPQHVLQMSTVLHRHLRTRGRYHDALTLHHQALITARASGDQAAELEALVGLGWVHRLLGRYGQASAHYQLARELARATGNRTGELNALTGLGWVHHLQGRSEQATDDFGRALHLARDTATRTGEQEALVGLGHVHRMQGRYQQATDHYQLARQLARATGNRGGELSALVGLGHVHRLRGRYKQATGHFGQALQLARATGNRIGELDALVGVGYLHRLQGRCEQSAHHFEQALRLARATGNRTGELDTLIGLGDAHRLLGRYRQANDHYQQLLDLAHESGDRNFEFEARQGLGRLQHATGHPKAAITHHDQALALARELGQPVDQARAHDGLAHAHHALHQHDQARRHWQRALDILTGLGVDHTDEAETTAETIRTHLAALAER